MFTSSARHINCGQVESTLEICKEKHQFPLWPALSLDFKFKAFISADSYLLSLEKA